MHVKIQELRRLAGLKKDVSIVGNEPWLVGIQSTFPLGFKTPLTGELELQLLKNDQVRLQGTIRAEPIVSCGHCDEPISWPIEELVDCLFADEQTQENISDLESLSEMAQISSLDSEVYYLSAKGEVDLEQVVNDTIQLAIPYKLVRSERTETGVEACIVCKKAFLD